MELNAAMSVEFNYNSDWYHFVIASYSILCPKAILFKWWMDELMWNCAQWKDLKWYEIWHHILYLSICKNGGTPVKKHKSFFLIYSCADDVPRMPSKREQLILNGKKWLNITPKSNYYIIKAMLLSVLISIRTIDCTFEHSFAYMNSFKLYVCVCCLSWLSWSA